MNPRHDEPSISAPTSDPDKSPRPGLLLSTPKLAFFTLVMLAGVLLFMEAFFYIAGRTLQRKYGMWRVPTPPPTRTVSLTYDEYMKRRDPIVGWPLLDEYGNNLDINGAQRNPHFPNGPRQGSWVSLYGDSFTEGGDTSKPEKNWGNLLAARLRRYVANFGMGGYGTDQAFLRFVKNRDDPSPIVIFGLHTADALRNLTRIRDLENYQQWFALKPRFELNRQGGLKLVPIPRLTEDEYLKVLTVRKPQLILPYENLHPNGPTGAIKLQFPFTVAVIRNFICFHGFRSRLLGYPEHMEFLRRGHPLQGLEIMAAITQEFVAVAKKRGKTPIVVILPLPEDMKYFLKSKVWPYQDLADTLGKRRIAFLDFGPHLLSVAHDTGQSLETFIGRGGHYNDAGNAVVADFI